MRLEGGVARIDAFGGEGEEEIDARLQAARFEERLHEAIGERFLAENALNPFAFPSLRLMEADVVAMACVQLRPEGRGWVRLASADPAHPPRILTNVLSTETNRAFFRRVIPQMREILATAPLADVVKAELMPGPADDLDAWIRANVRTAMHAAGSCAMGPGPDAVCDAKLRVRGLDGLRIADASVMPRIVG